MIRNMDARLRKLEAAQTPSVFPTCRRIVGRSPAECETRMNAMIASGQATETDRFVYRLICLPGAVSRESSQ
jgi:hypothetical protein